MNDCVIYLICRGRTTNDDLPWPMLLGRRLDARLTITDRLQSMAQAMHQRNLHTIYTSPSPRAMATARLIMKGCDDANLRITAALAAVDYGRWEGLTWREVMANDAETYAQHL
ncbi:unnamed protein product, partial [marine sediment metagenome]